MFLGFFRLEELTVAKAGDKNEHKVFGIQDIIFTNDGAGV